MANTLQAKKRARQAESNRQLNTSHKSKMRTSVKKVVYAIDAGYKEAATTAYKEAMPIVDAMARKGLIHKNKAARYKSRLNTQVRAL